MNFAFAGTPLFASLVLRELVELGRIPRLVISQPDRRRGRGRSVATPEAAVEAACRGLECFQTEDINSPELMDRLMACDVSAIVVAAFGQLLRSPLLDSFMCVNVHASLLPRYRGAAPVERALMAGETASGVSIMRITEPLDEGPWAERVEVSLGLRQDAGSVSRVLAVAGATALTGVLDAIEDGTVRWIEQAGEAVYARKLGTRDCWLDVRGSALQAHNQVRALSPAIGARACLGDAEVKIWRSWPCGLAGLGEIPRVAEAVNSRPGAIILDDARMYIGCADGVLEVMEIQPLSRARMTTPEYLRGYSECVGELLQGGCTNETARNV